MSRPRDADSATPLGSSAFRVFVDTAAIGFFLQDADQKLIYANQHLATMLGYDDPAGLIGAGASVFPAAKPGKDSRSYFEQWPTGPIPAHGQTFQRKDGGVVRALVTPYPVLNGQSEFVFVAAFVVDVQQLIDAGVARSEAGEESVLGDLTPREREVVSALVTGNNVREIAELHTISNHTVRNHIKAAYRKLGVHSRLHLMRAVMGELGPPDRSVY